MILNGEFCFLIATAFAKEMGFEVTDLSTPESIQKWQNWKDRNCQPNFRQVG